jgi:hypothetical protein
MPPPSAPPAWGWTDRVHATEPGISFDQKIVEVILWLESQDRIDTTLRISVHKKGLSAFICEQPAQSHSSRCLANATTLIHDDEFLGTDFFDVRH